MKIIREPKVYLTGRQVVNETEMDRFLAEHGLSWQTDTEVGAEKLCEVAGRLCYMSFGKGRKTNQEYLGHILEVGHGSVLEHATWNFIIAGVSRSFTHELVRHRAGFSYCLSGDTQIYSEHWQKGKRCGAKKRSLRHLYEMSLSPHGRSRLKLLRIRCLDEATGTFTVGRVRGVVCSGDKPVFRVELEDGKTIDCTKEHRFLTPTGWGRLEEVVGGLAVSPGGLATYGNRDAVLLVNGTPAYRDCEWLREQYHDRGFEQAAIAQMAGVSVHTIRAWVRRCELQKPMGSWTVGRKPWNRGVCYHAGWTHSQETRRLLSIQKSGDRNPQWKGGITPQGHVLRLPLLMRREEIFTRDNHTCRLCGVRGGRLTLHHVLPLWARPDLADDETNVVTVCRSCHHTLNGRELEYVEHFGRRLAEIPADACRPQGGGQLLVPRPVRIRSITFLGVQPTYDLEMEGSHHNFVANGIITHNSQLSQRYVDESEADFVEPEVIAGDPELHKIWLESMTASHAAYVQLVEKLADKYAEYPDKTMRRKLARQAARSVLPNATETKIFVTANGRALRHFIELRCNEFADVEIRRVAGLVLQIMQKEAPNVFGDYQWVDVPDGTRAATTKHRKV